MRPRRVVSPARPEVGRTVAQQAARPSRKVAPRDGGREERIMIMNDATWSCGGRCLWGASAPAAAMSGCQPVGFTKRLPAFLEQFVARARALRVGDGLDPATQMGRRVSRYKLVRIKYVEIGRQEGRGWRARNFRMERG